MSKIRVLSDLVANQIAAGEVVERPASVAKELIENSIDAGARRIEVEVEGGGRKLLRVSDDGEGMTHDDALLAFERHATSKVSTTEDLQRISTLGFRGEALASIASVARVELVTQTAGEQTATRVLIEGGRIRDVSPAARPRGTTISVRDLFFNVPARRKFLRSEATESFHLSNYVMHYALAHPEIAFALTNNGRETLRAAAATDLRERAYQIFGAEFLDNLLQVGGEQRGVARVGGYVSAPRERRTTRDAQYLFVNGRFVRDPLISRALSEGFRTVLPHGSYPAALLFLEVPLEEVDVNVHPSKTEVRFRRGPAVADVVRETVRATLASGGFVRLGETQDDAADFKTTETNDAPAALNRPTPSETRAHASASTASRDLDARTPTPQQEAMSFGSTMTPDDATSRFESNTPAAATHDSTGTSAAATHDSTAANSAQELLARLAPEEIFNFQGAPQPGEETEQEEDSSRPEGVGQLRDESRREAASRRTPARVTPRAGEAEASPPSSPSQSSSTQPSQHSSSPRSSSPQPSHEVASREVKPLPPLNSVAGIVREVAAASVSSNIRPLGQLEDSFIVATDPEGLLLIDQHAAHERILFDKYQALEATRQPDSQQLLLPETFDLSPAQVAVFDHVAAELESYGFGLMRLSGRTVAIRAVPADLPAGEARNFLAEVLDTVDAEKRGATRETLRDRIAVALARRAAVKSNTPLTVEKMRWLIERLLRTSSPTTSPHGRPIILRLTRRDIERGFQRS